MTASSADISVSKPTDSLQEIDQMEKEENGTAVSRLPRPLAIEVYTKIHNSTLSKDDLLDEIEDLVDEKYYIGEIVVSGGKEYVVQSSEKRGGLTMYTMVDGTKIGHRDLRRKKGLSVEEIKQIAIDDVILVDDKIWKVKEDLLKANPIREMKKFAPIFSSANRRASGAANTSSSAVVQLESSDSESEGVREVKEENGGEKKKNGNTPSRRAPRASGGPATSQSRRLLDKKIEKEAKDKEKAEKLKKEKEEKQKKKEEELRKKEEEKAKKQAEKEEKKAKRASNGTGLMDKFVKKETENGGGEGTAPLFSPSKWGERRTAVGVKKMDDAWKKRDLEAFNEACQWCEKNLSGVQRNSFENPIFKFSVQKMVDKTKDRQNMKGMTWAKKAEYKQDMAEKRKAHYSQFEPKIKAWFSEDIALDDLLITDQVLVLPEAKLMNCDEELLKCMEIAQYFVSMRKILLWNENISAEQLRDDLHRGLEGFRRSTYKMIANLFETAIQEKEYEKVAHCNARLSEFPITEHTISELIRAFFVGNHDMSYKRDAKPRTMIGVAPGPSNAIHDEFEEDDVEEMESEDKIEEVKTEETEDQEGEDDEDDDENSDEEHRKQRILALFSDPTHIYDWAPMAQLEVLYALKELVHGLPIIREWYLRDANSEQLTGLKAQANKITKKIDDFQQQLADLPSGEITDDMSRHQTREMEKVIKKRQNLEKSLDDLKDELEENRELAARERDDLERIYRVVSIGSDRHLRKYYWFAYSSDAGIWIQDFGQTSYEKWVLECAAQGHLDVETLEVENRPEYVDLPFNSSEFTEVWYKLDTEAAVRQLLESLKKNGKREKMLRKYISNNLEDILASIRKQKKEEESSGDDDVKMEEPDGDVKQEVEDSEGHDEAEDVKDSEDLNGTSEDVTSTLPNRFQGLFGSLKQTMCELLNDWKQSGITKIGDVQLFETRLVDANSLDEMKRLTIELATSIPKECLIEKFPTVVAFTKKCHSHLKVPRFCRRVQEATNASCLHLLLAYFDARIDQHKTLPELPCHVCHRKNGTNRKLLCKQCATVYHHNCHRPVISQQLFEEEGFKEGWWCSKCTKEDRRRQMVEAKEQREREQQNDETGEHNNNSDGSGGESDSEEEIEEEIELESRGRSAKRKANAAMRDVLEFEGVLRAPVAPPAPKRSKKAVVPEVQELFNSIEKANPRLYKVLQMIPSQTRSTRNSHHETRSLTEIEEDLDIYKDSDSLMEHLKQFFQQARGYIETHNPRKLDELDDLISELNFV